MPESGGGNIYNLTWDHDTFGAKNSSGQYGQGRMGLLIQPAPAEHADDGPRPESPSDIVDTNFDWGQVTHGSGQAAIGGSSGYGFRLLDSNFVGPSGFYASFDLCDYIRSWVITVNNLSFSPTLTKAQQDTAPDKVSTKGFDVENDWFSTSFVQEFGRDVTSVNNSVKAGTTTYHVDAAVLTHDQELYGL